MPSIGLPGATGMVSRFVISMLAGAFSLNKNRVEFSSGSRCLRTWWKGLDTELDLLGPSLYIGTFLRLTSGRTSDVFCVSQALNLRSRRK